MKKRDIPERACAYCENGKRLIDNESAICKYKGAVSLGYCCRKFVFDPLKMSPEPRRIKLNTKIETL